MQTSGVDAKYLRYWLLHEALQARVRWEFYPSTNNLKGWRGGRMGTEMAPLKKSGAL